MEKCNWPESSCLCYEKNARKEDPFGRIWMHCEHGLTLSKASMTRFVMFCLENNVEIGDIFPLNYRYKNSHVTASVRIKPELIQNFEAEVKAKLERPPRISLNCSSGREFSSMEK